MTTTQIYAAEFRGEAEKAWLRRTIAEKAGNEAEAARWAKWEERWLRAVRYLEQRPEAAE